jgi:Protein of unknown function (DUF4232)
MSTNDRLEDAAAKLLLLGVEVPDVARVIRGRPRNRIILRLGLMIVVLGVAGGGTYLAAVTGGSSMPRATGGHSLRGAARGFVVPWVDQKLTQAGLADATSSSAPPCRAADVAVSEVGEVAAVGHRAARFAFTNTSSAPCILIGAPGVVAGLADVVAPVTASAGPSVIPDPGPPLAIAPGAKAVINVENDQNCGASAAESYASSVTFSLPNGGGSIAYQIPAADQFEIDSSCGIHTSNFGVIPGPSPLSTLSPLEQVTVAVSAPQSVLANSTVLYDVSLTNPTASSIAVDPCPSYLEWLGVGNSRVSAVYVLNCSSVTAIGAGSTVKYQMQLAVPAGFPAGSGKLHWSLGGTSVFAEVPISVQ